MHGGIGVCLTVCCFGVSFDVIRSFIFLLVMVKYVILQRSSLLND